MEQANREVLLQDLQTSFGEKLEVLDDQFYPAVKVDPADLIQLMTILKEKYEFNHLSNLCAVDYGEEFEMVYHVHSYFKKDKLLVKTRVARNKAEFPSLVSVWPTADWQEREAYDLMGIKFKGHPNLLRVLLPDDFKGHPLRKDFKMVR